MNAQSINQQAINPPIRLGQSAPQVMRESTPVAGEMSELSMALSRLESTAIGLDQQLDPVKNLNRIPPSADGLGQAIASICPLGEQLRAFVGRVNLIQTQLATLRDAIEV